AGGGLERPDPALAQNHVGVAAAQDVLRGQEPLFDRGRDAALQEHRLAHVPQLAQQREILHVARADLEDVAVAVDQLDLAKVHHFGDQLQVLRARGVSQQTQALLAKALKTVRRASRLERAAAEYLRARLS